MKRAKLAKVLLVLVLINALVSGLAWAVVTGHLSPPRGALEVVPMVLSVPGWTLAIALWGFNSGESALSDALIVVTNTFVYSLAEILLLLASQAVGRARAKQRTE